MQRNRVVRNPGMFLPVDDQNARKQLHFMIKKLEAYSARQKGGVHEQALAERNRERHLFGLAKRHVRIREPGPCYLVCENNLNVGDRQLRLVNDQQRNISVGPCKSNLPGAFARASMLDARIE